MMSPRILVVDDEESWRKQFQDILETMGYESDALGGFDEAKRALETTNYDMALLDIDLDPPKPFVDFQLICSLLHQTRPKLPIVAVSGKPINPEFMFDLGERCGVVGFVPKSDHFLLDKLRKLVNDLTASLSVSELDELQYDLKDQPWCVSEFPPTTEIDEKQIEALKDKIDIVIITATETELKAVIHRLKPYQRRKNILLAFVGPETYYLGKLGEYTAVITKCRMGSIGEGSVILATEQAQRVWQPRAVIMVGIAFGKDPAKQKIGDVLVASQIISYEQQRVGEEVIYRGVIQPSNTALLNRFENAPKWRFTRPDGKICSLIVGPILSGEKLVDDPSFKMDLFRQFPQAIGGEMEGAGLCAASGRVGIAWILVKSICDWGDGKKHNQHQPLAAASASSLVCYVLSQETALDAVKRR